MKPIYTRNMKTIKDGGLVTISNYKTGQKIAAYDIATGQLKMYDLATPAESEALLDMARKAAESPNDYEDSREVSIRKRSRAIALAAIIVTAIVIICQWFYLLSLTGCL